MCENVGEIYISKNNERKRTKYIDVKYHFIREYIENGVIKIIFVKSEDNMADPMTKNLSVKDFEKHRNYLDIYNDKSDQGRVSKV